MAIGARTLVAEVVAAAVLASRIRRAVLIRYEATRDRRHRLRQAMVAADVARELDIIDSPWFRRRVAAVLTSMGVRSVRTHSKVWRLGIRAR